jgi:hypothetical protein
MQHFIGLSLPQSEFLFNLKCNIQVQEKIHWPHVPQQVPEDSILETTKHDDTNSDDYSGFTCTIRYVFSLSGHLKPVQLINN